MRADIDDVNGHYYYHGARGNPNLIPIVESAMRLVQPYLRNLTLLIATSFLLSASSAGASSPKPGALISLPCSSSTGLYCEIYGHGDPILFLAGLGGDSYSWQHMIAPLSGRHQLILLDLRGQGKSPKPDDKHYSILEQGELVYRFIVEHDLRNLTLVGNSYGGAVSLLLAIKLCAERDSRLAKLILIDSGGYPDHLPTFLKVLRTPILGWLAVHLIPPKTQIRLVLRQSYYDPSKITSEQVNAYARPLASRGGRHALLETGKQAIPNDIQKWIDKYPTISVPTLILWGEEDRVLPPLIGERLNRAIPNSRMDYIKDAGHIPQEEEPDAVICRIKAFLTPGENCPPEKRGKGERAKGKEKQQR
jgi:pimeloyl-ACP methyl ester carboxylesterase